MKPRRGGAESYKNPRESNDPKLTRLREILHRTEADRHVFTDVLDTLDTEEGDAGVAQDYLNSHLDSLIGNAEGNEKERLLFEKELLIYRLDRLSKIRAGEEISTDIRRSGLIGARIARVEGEEPTTVHDLRVVRKGEGDSGKILLESTQRSVNDPLIKQTNPFEGLARTQGYYRRTFFPPDGGCVARVYTMGINAFEGSVFQFIPIKNEKGDLDTDNIVNHGCAGYLAEAGDEAYVNVFHPYKPLMLTRPKNSSRRKMETGTFHIVNYETGSTAWEVKASEHLDKIKAFLAEEDIKILNDYGKRLSKDGKRVMITLEIAVLSSETFKKFSEDEYEGDKESVELEFELLPDAKVEFSSIRNSGKS